MTEPTIAAAPPRRRRPLLTVAEIRRACADARATGRDKWLSDPAPRRRGRLVVRCRASGEAVAGYRYTTADGRRDLHGIGRLSVEGTAGGLTLAQARAEVARLVALRDAGNDDIRLAMERVAAEERAAAQARAEADRRARNQAGRGSLGELVACYIESLRGRSSCDDVRRLLDLHVIRARPDLVARPAAEVSARDFRDILAVMMRAPDGGIRNGATARKVRACLRRAYRLAAQAEFDPTAPPGMADFGIEHNPLDRLPSLSEYQGVRDRALTVSELVAFWKRLKTSPTSAAADALRAVVLLGGQRVKQVVRVRPLDVDLDSMSVLIRDIKGRGRAHRPRLHSVPIVPELEPVLRRRLALTRDPGDPLFSTAADGVAVRPESVLQVAYRIVAAMETAGELERGRFAVSDIRRTAETHLASLGVSREVRAHLQSHGLGGVQQRHYDRHDYDVEKRAALRLWVDRLEGARRADVVPLRVA